MLGLLAFFVFFIKWSNNARCRGLPKTIQKNDTSSEQRSEVKRDFKIYIRVILSWEGTNCTVITCKHQSILVTDCRELVRFPVSISTLITRIKFVCCKHESALNESKWSANSGSYTTIETYVKLPQWTRQTCIAVSPSCSSVSRIKQTSHFDQKLIIKYMFCVWYRESSRHWYSTNKTTVNCRF